MGKILQIKQVEKKN